MKIRGCGTVRFRWLERYTASGMSFQSFPTTLFFSKMEKEKEASEISDEISWPALFFRESWRKIKEVIQPQVPLRLPCDDLTLLAKLRFDFIGNEASSRPYSGGLTGIAFFALSSYWHPHRTNGFPVCGEPPVQLFLEPFDFFKINRLLEHKLGYVLEQFKVPLSALNLRRMLLEERDNASQNLFLVLHLKAITKRVVGSLVPLDVDIATSKERSKCFQDLLILMTKFQAES